MNNEGIKIFLDDQGADERKDWVGAEWVRVSTVPMLMVMLKLADQVGETVEQISFDNDLGENELEGRDGVRQLMEIRPEIFNGQTKLTVHSQNPSAREAMKGMIGFAQTNWEELVEAKNRPYPFEVQEQ